MQAPDPVVAGVPARVDVRDSGPRKPAKTFGDCVSLANQSQGEDAGICIVWGDPPPPSRMLIETTDYGTSWRNAGSTSTPNTSRGAGGPARSEPAKNDKTPLRDSTERTRSRFGRGSFGAGAKVLPRASQALAFSAPPPHAESA